MYKFVQRIPSLTLIAMFALFENGEKTEFADETELLSARYKITFLCRKYFGAPSKLHFICIKSIF